MKSLFSVNLKNELKYQGILMKELSARTGIPIATLDCYIGKRSVMPSAEAAVKIASALNVTVEYLITGKTMRGSTNNFNKKTRELIYTLEHLDSKQCEAVVNAIKSFLNN